MLNYEDFEEKHFNVEKFLKERLLMFLDDVALPTGGTAKRELVFHSGAVAMIPLTAEGKIVLVKQFRKPLEQVILEIPAGKLILEKKINWKRRLCGNWKKKLGIVQVSLPT